MPKPRTNPTTNKILKSPLVTLALLAGGIYLLVSVAMERPSPGAFVAEVLAMAALCNVAYWLGYRAALADLTAGLGRVAEEIQLVEASWPLLQPSPATPPAGAGTGEDQAWADVQMLSEPWEPRSDKKPEGGV